MGEAPCLAAPTIRYKTSYGPSSVVVFAVNRRDVALFRADCYRPAFRIAISLLWVQPVKGLEAVLCQKRSDA